MEQIEEQNDWINVGFLKVLDLVLDQDIGRGWQVDTMYAQLTRQYSTHNFTLCEMRAKKQACYGKYRVHWTLRILIRSWW